MNRRQFLTSLIALGAGLVLPEGVKAAEPSGCPAPSPGQFALSQWGAANQPSQEYDLSPADAIEVIHYSVYTDKGVEVVIYDAGGCGDPVFLSENCTLWNGQPFRIDLPSSRLRVFGLDGLAYPGLSEKTYSITLHYLEVE